jgi:hypothetical protein
MYALPTVASFGSATAGVTDNVHLSGDDNPLQDTDYEDDQFMQVDFDQDLRALVRNLKGTTLSSRLEQTKNFSGSVPTVAKPRGGSRSKKRTGSFENRGRSRLRDTKQRRSVSRQKSSSLEKTRRYRSNTPRRAGGGGGGLDSERKDKKGVTRKKNDKR